MIDSLSFADYVGVVTFRYASVSNIGRSLCPKRPTDISKATYLYAKRDLLTLAYLHRYSTEHTRIKWALQIYGKRPTYMPKETRCNTHELWIRVTQMPDMYALHECLHSSDFLPRAHTLSLPHTIKLTLTHSLSQTNINTHTHTITLKPTYNIHSSDAETLYNFKF